MYDDDRDALAAEYVLGTLATDERDQAEALLAIDPGFAEIVRVWERRLGELNVMVEAVEPPADIWEKIRTGIDSGVPRGEAQMETALPAIGDAAPHTAPEPTFDLTPDVTSEKTAGTAAEPAPDLLSEAPHDLDTPPQDLDEVSPVAALASSLLPPEPGAEKPASFEPTASPAPPKVERSADIIVLRRGVQRWRGITVAVSAIAALLAIYIGVEQFAPGLIPISRQSQTEVAARTPPGARLVAVLQQEPTAPAFLLTVDPQSRTLTVRTVAAGAEADRSYQLWLISSKYANPRSLGLVGTEQFTTRAIPADFDVETLRTASYAVSLEPAGGSPKDVPTGPILFTGKMVESVPGSPS